MPKRIQKYVLICSKIKIAKLKLSNMKHIKYFNNVFNYQNEFNFQGTRLMQFGNHKLGKDLVIGDGNQRIKTLEINKFFNIAQE